MPCGRCCNCSFRHFKNVVFHIGKIADWLCWGLTTENIPTPCGARDRRQRHRDWWAPTPFGVRDRRQRHGRPVGSAGGGDENFNHSLIVIALFHRESCRRQARPSALASSGGSLRSDW